MPFEGIFFVDEKIGTPPRHNLSAEGETIVTIAVV